MKFTITGDTDSNTGLGNNKIWNYFNYIGKYFELKNYGKSIEGIGICIVCVNPLYHNFTQRKKFNKKSKIIYHDIMLDYDEVIKLEFEQKIKLLKNALLIFIDEWNQFDDFDKVAFKRDLNEVLDLFIEKTK